MSLKSLAILLLPFVSLTQGAAILNARQGVTIPAECDVIPTWEVTSFNWFNSSNNLDCVTQSNAPPEGVCFNSTDTPGVLIPCDGNLGPCDRCGVGACFTGLPLQPAGFGPPDTIAIGTNVPGYQQCYTSNPQSIRRSEVGNGFALCGGVAYRINFVGNSNTDISTGHVDLSPNQSWNCNNGSTIRASGGADFEIECSRDAGNNATCVIPNNQRIVIPVLSYTIT